MPQYDDGRTVKIIIHGSRFSGLDKEHWAREFLQTLCQKIKMTPLAGPHSTSLLCLDKDKTGVSAVLIIKESHIAIHTWPELQGVRILIDSCVMFSLRHVIPWLRWIFKTKEIEVFESVVFIGGQSWKKVLKRRISQIFRK